MFLSKHLKTMSTSCALERCIASVSLRPRPTMEQNYRGSSRSRIVARGVQVEQQLRLLAWDKKRSSPSPIGPPWIPWLLWSENSCVGKWPEFELQARVWVDSLPISLAFCPEISDRSFSKQCHKNSIWVPCWYPWRSEQHQSHRLAFPFEMTIKWAETQRDEPHLQRIQPTSICMCKWACINMPTICNMM